MTGILRAFRSIAARRAAQTVVEAAAGASPSTSSSSSYSSSILPPVIHRFVIDLARSIDRYCNVHVPLKSAMASFLKDKSQSELIFLTSIFLAVLLFAIILPVCEALFFFESPPSSLSQHIEKKRAEQDEERCRRRSQRRKRREQQAAAAAAAVHEQGDISPPQASSSSSSPSRMRVYKAGVGVVKMDVREIAETTTTTTLSRGSSGGSCLSDGTGSGRDLYPIEESEEEYLDDDECDAATEEREHEGLRSAREEDDDCCQSDAVETNSTTDSSSFESYREFAPGADAQACDSLRRNTNARCQHEDEDVDNDVILETPTSSPPTTPKQKTAQMMTKAAPVASLPILEDLSWEDVLLSQYREE